MFDPRDEIEQNAENEGEDERINKSTLVAHDFDNDLRIWKLSRRLLGIDRLPINSDLKHAAARRNQFERADVLFELQEFVRQTDGLRLVVSSCAILDCDVQGHSS